MLLCQYNLSKQSKSSKEMEAALACTAATGNAQGSVAAVVLLTRRMWLPKRAEFVGFEMRRRRKEVRS